MLAVFMQELPHRIGDYAVLVNAGMTPFQVSFRFSLQNSVILVYQGNTLQLAVNCNCVYWLSNGSSFT